MKFLYDPHADEPETMNWVPPVLDLHGMTLVSGSFVVPEKGSSPTTLPSSKARTVKAGRVFDVDELFEPQLYAFVSTDRRFRRARRSDLKESA